MGVSAAGRDHTFHALPIRRVVRETEDACSFVLEVPRNLRAAFSYEAGQFCTFRVTVGGCQYFRCYSMSSSPAVDDELSVTVKRVPGGVVSNWMLDTLAEGDAVEASCPAGVFCLGPVARDIVAFAAGSGITPVFSLLKSALATTGRRTHLLYANRDPGAVIFAAELDRLATRHADRFRLAHRYDVVDGFVDADAIRTFLAAPPSVAAAEFYLCGPPPFMEVVEAALLGLGVAADKVHIERFSPPEPDEPPEEPSSAPAAVTIELGGRTAVATHRQGATLLQTARQLGLSPPYSCESGNCATCMARLVEGEVTMHANNALNDDEVADGWVLTCQAVPVSPSVRVVYGE